MIKAGHYQMPAFFQCFAVIDLLGLVDGFPE